MSRSGRQGRPSQQKRRTAGIILLVILVLILVSAIAGGHQTTQQETSQSTETVSSSAASAPQSSSQNFSQESAPEDQAASSQSDEAKQNTPAVSSNTAAPPVTLADIPAFSGNAYIAINDNTPYFDDAELSSTSFESYSDLDSFGRCGVAYASVGQDLMPTEKRGSIGDVKPSGWHTVKYDSIDGKYLYNRCHLIGYQLTGENANVKNLITGTRFLNVEGMLPFENMVADYVKETGNHVQYRVTPVFDGDNLVASGVLMEAKSVEDGGAGVLFNVYCYNNQPGITIDYATGDSTQAE